MKGSASTLTALLLSLIVLASLTGTMINAYRNYYSSLRSEALSYSKLLTLKEREVRGFVTQGGLMISAQTPPVHVLGVLEISPDGTIKELSSGLNIASATPVKVIGREAVEAVKSAGGKILVLLPGKYLLIDPRMKGENAAGSGGELELKPYLNPYVTLGKVIDPESFLENPIPGTPEEVGANYEPDVYFRLRPENTSLLGGVVKVTYINAHYDLKLYNYGVAFTVFIPLSLSNPPQGGVGKYLLRVRVKPLYVPDSSKNVLYLHVALRPALYYVRSEDFLRTYLVTEAGNTLLLSQFKNSVSRSPYWVLGDESSGMLSSYFYVEGTSVITHVDVFDVTELVEVNYTEAYDGIKRNPRDYVALAGIQAYVTYSFKYGSADLINPYASVEIWCFNVTKPYTFVIPQELSKTPVLVNLPTPATKVRVEGPGGTELPVWRPSNVISSEYGNLVWFEPIGPGNYTVEVMGGGGRYESKRVPLTGLTIPEIRVEGKERVLSRWESVKEDLTEAYVLGSKGSYESLNYTFTHTFTGDVYRVGSSIAHLSVTYSGLNDNYTYRIKESDGNCGEVSFGWSPVTEGLNDYGWVRDAVGCTYSLRIKASYSQRTSDFRLTAYPEFEGYFYPSFEVVFKLVAARNLVAGTVNGLTVFSVNESPTLILINLAGDLPHL